MWIHIPLSQRLGENVFTFICGKNQYLFIYLHVLTQLISIIFPLPSTLKNLRFSILVTTGIFASTRASKVECELQNLQKLHNLDYYDIEIYMFLVFIVHLARKFYCAAHFFSYVSNFEFVIIIK